MKSFGRQVWDLFKTLAIAGFLAFFCIRGFVFEPFKIPSGSMMPNLLVGDFLFVSKYAYGNRLPMTDYFFWQREPERGDIVVFKMKDSGLPGSFFGFGETLFIKRLVGLPGDTLEYRNKTLFINGQAQVQENIGTYTFETHDGRDVTAALLEEQLGGVRHTILQDPATPGQDVPAMEIPEGQYVVIGDNRDNSRDARYWEWPQWGLIPRADIMGRAEFIWWSWDDSWTPRFERMFESLRARHTQVVPAAVEEAPAA